MTVPKPYECRWVKRKASGSYKLILQQYVPSTTYSDKPGGGIRTVIGGSWADVPVTGQPDDESTVRIVKEGSGPLEAPTQATSALEPALRSPAELEHVIEKQMFVLVGLMKMRTEVPGSLPYDGTLVLVHGSGKQRMFVNGFERSMPPRSMLIVNDADIHQFQTHTVPPSEANKLPRKSP